MYVSFSREDWCNGLHANSFMRDGRPFETVTSAFPWRRAVGLAHRVRRRHLLPGASTFSLPSFWWRVPLAHENPSALRPFPTARHAAEPWGNGARARAFAGCTWWCIQSSSTEPSWRGPHQSQQSKDAAHQGPARHETTRGRLGGARLGSSGRPSADSPDRPPSHIASTMLDSLQDARASKWSPSKSPRKR